MAISGVYTLTVSRDDIIRQAMLNMGKLGEGEIPSPQETIDMALKLNMLVKQWQGKSDFAPGLKTWTRRRGYLFLHNNTGQYTVGPAGTGWTLGFTLLTLAVGAIAGQTVLQFNSVAGINAGDNIGVQIGNGNGNGDIQWTTVASVNAGLNQLTLSTGLLANSNGNSIAYDYPVSNQAQNPLTIESAILRDNNNEDVPMRIFPSTQDYDVLPSKTDPDNISDPTGIYFEWQLANSYVFTDVAAAQDVTKYLVLTYLDEIQVFTNPLDNPEYPAEWFDPLCWGLTKRAAPMFNAPWTKLMQDNFNESLTIARKKQPENTSLFFQPGID